MTRLDSQTSFLAIAGAVVAGVGVAYSPLVAAAAAGAFLGLYLRNRPRQAFAFYVAVLFLVPSWVQARFFVPLPPSALAAIIVLPALLQAKNSKVLNVLDVILVVVTGIAAFGAVTGISPKYAFTALVVQWLSSYLIGRGLGRACGEQFVANVVSVLAVFVAIWAMIEFGTGQHIFENLPGTNNQGGWAVIQERGGYARSEAAFGHAIILGGVLALTIPFLFASTLRFRNLMMAIIGGGIIVSLSRGPMLAAILTVALIVVFLPSSLGTGKRIGAAITAGLTAVFAVPTVLSIFGAIQGDLDASTDYRTTVFSTLPSDMRIIGLAERVGVSPYGGGTTYRGANSIDSTPLILGMWWGWIAILLLVLAMLFAVVRIIRRRGSVAEIALVGQIPVLITVAPITQYGPLLFLVAGLAVAAYEPATARSVATECEPRLSLPVLSPRP
ncbi:hypothetical protein R4172_12195 [Rhodococcus kroppenstedtii]|uniref:hypothetical protein n=1 Tax=Rhodococcoides kroppenstedtii TaxID=293050 RepID=UPI0029537138|nr:hypothetical protein [Rhodococcus kroppenstedtii]MDV7198322.1 hypothetical protein [Rhodococcus kroppenstedtii]